MSAPASPSPRRGLYDRLYDFVRATPALNHLAHRIIQSEWIHRLPPYRRLYWRTIRRKAAAYMRHPPVLEITVTNRCNSACVMCPPAVHAGDTFIDHDLSLRVMREARDLGAHSLILTGGEPLLDERLEEKINAAKEMGFASVQMFSNGALMDDARARSILDTGLDTIVWSIDSCDPEEYERIRIGLDFETTIANLRRFMALKQERGQVRPLTRIHMVSLPGNRAKRAEYLDFFSSLVDVVQIIDAHSFAGSVDAEASRAGAEYSQQTRYPCYILFYKVVVDAHGHLKKCGIDYDPRAVIGDLRTHSLSELLASEHLRGIKEAHLRQDFSEPGCVDCPHKESWLEKR